MENFKSTIIILLLVFGLLTTVTEAKSPSLLLQEGLYAEETEGNLDKAIEIYEQVVEEASEIQRLAAKATYQLGMCYLKKGDKTKAAEYFQQVVSNHQTQKILVKKATRQLEKVSPVKYIFGPTIEKVINDDGVGEDFMFDLDTGKFFSVSDAKKWSEASGDSKQKGLEDFIMESGVDLFGETSEKSLMGIDMIAMPTHNERWDMSPDDVVEQVSMGKAGSPIPLSADGELPKTFVFKTGQGGMGILQITDMQAGIKPRHFKIRYKMLQKQPEKVVLAKAAKVFLPDADTPGVNIVLDLASGELLPAGTGQQQLTIFRNLGKGDLAYDRVLICLRGAKAQRIGTGMSGEYLGRLKAMEQIEDMTAYQLDLGHIPGRYLVTTAEGKDYEVTILSANSSGINLEYKLATRNVVTIVRDFLRASIAGDTTEAMKLIKPGSAVVNQLEDFTTIPNRETIQIASVHADNKKAFAITDVIFTDNGKDGLLTITLIKQRGLWMIDDIDMETSEKAETDLQVFLTRHPNAKPVSISVISKTDKLLAEDLTAQGWKLWGQRKLTEAESKFKEAIAKNPEAEGAYQGLGWAQLNQGKKLNAKDSFEKCIELNPKNSAALNGLGWIAHGQGNIDEAIQWWEKAVEAQPGATASLSGLTKVYMEKKEYDKAIKYYEMWLKAEPNNKQAKEGLEKAKEKLE